MVILTGSFILERNLATIDADNYAAHTNDINGLGINLIESHKMVAHMSRPEPKAFNSDNLLRDLIEKSKIILEKKFTRRAEDIYNDDFSEFLRGREYYACDQTRSGISPGGVNPGEIDIMIRSPKTGAPESIIESFILNSFGPGNTTISKHLNKLLNNYDTAGLGRNFILIFSTLSDLKAAWENYRSYIKDLNNKPDFKTKYSLISFEDVSARWGTPINVKIGLATHNRDGSFVEVFHLFINMYIDEQTLSNS
jgi:internalin A